MSQQQHQNVVATPFEWTPYQQQQLRQQQTPLLEEDHFTPPPIMPTLSHRAGSEAYSISSMSDVKRPTSTAFSGSQQTASGSSPQTPAPNSELVDQIALRLADIMSARSGSAPDPDAPPPMYDGPPSGHPPGGH